MGVIYTALLASARRQKYSDRVEVYSMALFVLTNDTHAVSLRAEA